MKTIDEVLPRPVLGETWLNFMRKHRARPHIRFWTGRWYVHPSRDTSFAITSGITLLDAWRNYLNIETEIEYQRAILAAARGGKFSMNIIAAAWQRLRGKRGKA